MGELQQYEQDLRLSENMLRRSNKRLHGWAQSFESQLLDSQLQVLKLKETEDHHQNRVRSQHLQIETLKREICQLNDSIRINIQSETDCKKQEEVDVDEIEVLVLEL